VTNYSIIIDSSVLRRKIHVRFLVPEGDNLQCLFLLHGFAGNQDEWDRMSRIRSVAEEFKIAVVMPGCGNGYYEDTQENMSKFIAEELVAYAVRELPISGLKKDTFIGGVSMGGFGALLVAAKYSHVFGKVASFSGAFIIHDVAIGNPGILGNADVNFFRSVFGDFSTLEGSSRDPVAEMIRSSKTNNAPAILLLCGRDDVLYRANQRVVKELQSNGIAVAWYGAGGRHQWAFWNNMLPYVIRWLVAGILPEEEDGERL